MLPLGSGAYGEVHLAWDRQVDRWVALKRFTGQDELGLLRMVIESRIRVSHPHLVRTLAFHLVDDRAWLVTELARGGSLRGLMTRTGALPWGWVAEAVDQVLAALTALHATGVVHRDLKPANLLLRSYGATSPHLLVGDFGIAMWRTVSMTGVGAAIGTPGYLAPEYLDGGQPSPATDLFAVGVLAAELLAGRRLVHHSNASPTMPSSWGEVLPIPPGVPPAVATVLQRMASPDPTRRYRDCAQAREALLAVAPRHLRGDLTTVEAPDLLAAVPPGWTPDGPEQPTATLRRQDPVPTEPASVPDLVGLPIDGGPTGLVPENQATAASPVPTSPGDEQTDSATAPDTTSTGLDSPDTPPGESPADVSATPDTPPEDPTAQLRGHASPGGPASPPQGSSTRAMPRRRIRQAVVLVVLVLLAAAAGILWWAATHHTVDGHPTARTGAGRPEQSAGRWVPTVIAPCNAVDIAATRTGENGRERCQRTPTPDQPQHWVEEPSGGFPTSDPGGPFPGEHCGNDGDRRYSPVGDHLECQADTWHPMT
ncbi:serine/threonine-protein kinase [Actinophytocola oryzae]|uniref:non-specific serine/threonine protein kinase n=1 Tax=Actinophytocola oryzae TaxID=502181 RepID=A0A4R7UV64_9PSEU|nr:serine/threonine-protein kinase [Actinophytocola oryzae]